MDAGVGLLENGQDLSDEQIENLLQQAEARVQKQQQNGTVALKSKDTAISIPKPPKNSDGAGPYVSTDGQIAHVDSARLVDVRERESANGIRRVEDPLVKRQKKLEVAKEKKANAGAKWFNMPKTNLTPELKRDWQLIKMRNVLDPHRHYKKDNAKAPPPEFSQVGTLVEGPTEFYSSRIQKSDRKRTLAEEVLAQEQESGRFKRKYGDIQVAKTSGKKGHYKAMMEKRYGSGKKRGRK